MRRMILAAIGLIAATATASADPDIAKGEQAFRKCMACHMVGPDAKMRVGPPLNGVVGAKWAHFEGYSYSQDIKDGAAAGKVWDDETLNAYLTSPKAVAPKGKMAFVGIKSDEERANLIAFLAQFNADGSKK
ncbi:c-type cytochrome [Xanthobacteraceae bacterium A53D]